MLLGRSLFFKDVVRLKLTSGACVSAGGVSVFKGERLCGEKLTSLSSKVTQLGKRTVVGVDEWPFMEVLFSCQLTASISISSSSWRDEELSAESAADVLPLVKSSVLSDCRSV